METSEVARLGSAVVTQGEEVAAGGQAAPDGGQRVDVLGCDADRRIAGVHQRPPHGRADVGQAERMPNLVGDGDAQRADVGQVLVHVDPAGPVVVKTVKGCGRDLKRQRHHRRRRVATSVELGPATMVTGASAVPAAWFHIASASVTPCICSAVSAGAITDVERRARIERQSRDRRRTHPHNPRLARVTAATGASATDAQDAGTNAKTIATKTKRTPVRAVSRAATIPDASGLHLEKSRRARGAAAAAAIRAPVSVRFGSAARRASSPRSGLDCEHFADGQC